jgi:hypothetical protein
MNHFIIKYLIGLAWCGVGFYLWGPIEIVRSPATALALLGILVIPFLYSTVSYEGISFSWILLIGLSFFIWLGGADFLFPAWVVVSFLQATFCLDADN